MVNTPISNIKKVIKSDITLKSLIIAGLFISVFIILFLGTSQQKYDLKVGDIATEDIYAPADAVDKMATDVKLKNAEESVQPVYKLDLTVQIDIEKRVDSFFNEIELIKSDTAMDKDQKLNAIEQESNISLKADMYEVLLDTPDSELKQLRDNVKYIINQILGERITEEQLNDKRTTIEDFFTNLPKKSKLNEAGIDIAVMVLRPNMFFDEQTTTMKKAEARANVEEVIIKKDTKIVNKGQEVTVQQLQLLENYGLLNSKSNKGQALRLQLGYVMIIGANLFLLGLYCIRYDKKIWNSNSNILLLSIIILMSLLIASGANIISEYLILLPACTMLLSILLNPKAAIITNVVMAIFITYITGFNISSLTIMLLSGIIGAMMVSNTHHRSTIMIAGLVIGLASVAIVFSFGSVMHVDPGKLLGDSIYGFMGGILSSIFTIGILPFLEAVFDIITPIKLLELSNPNQPLLRRLLIEAPGTYYHSILVGNLSEAAADDIGANGLLCRVGSYYHDIGKLRRTYFFKENQITKDNPHDKITPNLSALIITSHVKDGIEMAKKYKLPSMIINIIREHHGNTLVAFFYHKALNSEGAELVTEDKFRYPFPRPQSKEAAIVMLADSVEAYIRSLTEPTQNQVEQGVRKIIKEKLYDSQLDNCDLTLKDLEIIAQAFIKVLAGIFHDRIEYPEIKDI